MSNKQTVHEVQVAPGDIVVLKTNEYWAECIASNKPYALVVEGFEARGVQVVSADADLKVRLA